MTAPPPPPLTLSPPMAPDVIWLHAESPSSWTAAVQAARAVPATPPETSIEVALRYAIDPGFDIHTVEPPC